MENKLKQNWIEILRVMATLAVIFLHISMTIITNYSIEETGGTVNYVILDICQLISRWAVPCFIMITGTLLLEPNKKVDLVKIKKYVLRMLVVLITFGVFYSFLELFFESRTINIKMIFESILNTLQGKTWAHMWYIYMLIGLYIITPIIKTIINNTKENTLFYFIVILIIGTTIIPTINNLLNIDIENFMMVDVAILYYITGYYMTLKNNKLTQKPSILYMCSIISLLLILAIDIINIICNHENLSWIININNIFIYIFSIGIFCFVKQTFENKKDVNKIVSIISKYSFLMYLIHPFFINVLYKVFSITPLNFPIILGIIIMFIIITLLTFILSVILKKVPFIKKYV